MEDEMKRRTLAALALVAVLAALAVPALAAEPPRLFVLHQEIVKPSMIPLYEQTTKEFLGLVQQHRSASPAFWFTTFAGHDYVYSYVGPIQSFATIDTINAGFQALAEASGPKWPDVMKRNGEAIDYIRESVLMEDPSLSYTPDKPRIKDEEARFFHFDLYYVQPGREPEAEALAREFVDLFRRKGVTSPYRLFKVVMGPETPLLTVVIPARDAADYAAQDAAARELLGAEGQALFQRAFALSRRFEQHEAWIRPDLSLPPAGK
jgi:hypothetical protein